MSAHSHGGGEGEGLERALPAMGGHPLQEAGEAEAGAFQNGGARQPGEGRDMGPGHQRKEGLLPEAREEKDVFGVGQKII